MHLGLNDFFWFVFSNSFLCFIFLQICEDHNYFYQGIHFVIVYLAHFFWWNMLFFSNFLHTVVETTDFVVILTEDA